MGRARAVGQAGAPRALRTAFFGRLEYEAANRLQESLRERLLSGAGGEHLLLLEHDHVYTLGRNAKATDVLAPPQWLREHRVAVVETDRGGDVTYHGPGQLVGYPIVDLAPDRRDVRRYVRDLQEVLVRTLADFQLAATPGLDGQPVGVWTPAGKIASIGVHLRRWVTTHGLALNVAPDLAFFRHIVPCGMPGLAVTSIAAQLANHPTLIEVAHRLAGHFAAVFGREVEWLSPRQCRELLATAPHEAVAADAR